MLRPADASRDLLAFEPLADLVAALSVDAINVQRVFDAAHDGELRALAEVLPLIHETLGPAGAALFPSRLVVRTFEVETRLRISVERTRGVEVKVMPLNLGYDLRYGSTAVEENRLRILVEQLPPREA